MTDRVRGLTVLLERDIREDDCESLINAIMQFRGVLRVEKRIVDGEAALSQIRARTECGTKLIAIANEMFK